MNLKSQMIGQIFVFIIAAIIFILILIYGYSAINNFIKKSEQVSLIDFKTDLVSSIDQIKSDYGSVRKVELRVPARYTEFCIISSNLNASISDFSQKHPLMFSAWKTGSENVFLFPKQDSPIFIPDIEIIGGYECIPIKNSKLYLRLEGLGDKVRISEW